MESIRGLLPFVEQAGSIAASRQHLVTRSLKEDGSILTQVDKDLDAFLRDGIMSLFPEANLISEETSEQSDLSGNYTFAVDPIDGTDCYSQGMPGWSISIGLLDASAVPVAGFVFAPRWGLGPAGGSLFFTDIGGKPTLNGEPTSDPGTALGSPQVLVGSDIHKLYRMDGFPGKVRNIGSTAIHLVAPLLHSGVCGTIFNPNFVWDIAGAHAVLRSIGLSAEYFDGRPIDYRKLLHRARAEDVIIAGTKPGIDLIRRCFVPIKT